MTNQNPRFETEIIKELEKAIHAQTESNPLFYRYGDKDHPLYPKALPQETFIVSFDLEKTTRELDLFVKFDSPKVTFQLPIKLDDIEEITNRIQSNVPIGPWNIYGKGLYQLEFINWGEE